MARDHARVYLSIWDDDDFRGLSPAAQHLYFVLLTAPDMTYAGVADWRPNRLCKRAGGWSPEAVEIAAQELAETLYVVVDCDTEEVLLRSLIRHDGLLEQPNMAVAVRKAWAAIASLDLRGVVVHELARLHSDRPDLKGWPRIAELLGKPSLNPSERPPFQASVNPSGKGSDNPFDGDTSHPSDSRSEKGSLITVPSSRSSLPTPVPGSEVSDLGGDRYETQPASGVTSRPTCSRHPNGNPADDPCAGCARVREWDEQQASRHRTERLAAAKSCRDCGGSGWIEDEAGVPVAKCEHRRSA